MLVEGVQQAVREAPEEEEDGDEANGVEGVSKGQLGGFRRPVVANSEGTLPEESLDAHAAPHSVSNVFVMLCVIELGAFATVEPYVVLAVSGM